MRIPDMKNPDRRGIRLIPQRLKTPMQTFPGRMIVRLKRHLLRMKR